MYYFSKTVNMTFEEAVVATEDSLQHHGFTVLAEIDVQSALKRCLAVDFRPYVIISACNPQLTHRAIQLDAEIGSIFPCNLVVQQRRDGRVEVSAADPAASLGTISHVELNWLAQEIRSRVQQVIDGVGALSKSQSVLNRIGLTTN